MDSALLVARIGKPHGLRGEVTVQVHTDDPAARFTDGAVFATQAPAGSGVPKALTLASTRVHRGIWLLTFAEIPDRTGAESLRGTRLFLDTGDAATVAVDDAADDAWYEGDLVGLSAYDPAGQQIGEVIGLESGGVQDRLVLRLTDGHEVDVPFVSAIVPEVDIAAGRVIIDAPAGLLDLGRE